MQIRLPIEEAVNKPSHLDMSSAESWTHACHIYSHMIAGLSCPYSPLAIVLLQILSGLLHPFHELDRHHRRNAIT